jgi:hypothetical protein
MRPIAKFYSRLRKEYADRLSGINRVSGTDVAAGERIPGFGRSYFASLRLPYNRALPQV